jgi:hypothetical protein
MARPALWAALPRGRLNLLILQAGPEHAHLQERQTLAGQRGC